MDEPVEISTLHRNIIINSDKQHSGQGSVFYCKVAGRDQDKESILKIYANTDIKGF